MPCLICKHHHKKLISIKLKYVQVWVDLALILPNDASSAQNSVTKIYSTAHIVNLVSRQF